jgi:hypothetical protein
MTADRFLERRDYICGNATRIEIYSLRRKGNENLRIMSGAREEDVAPTIGLWAATLPKDNGRSLSRHLKQDVVNAIVNWLEGADLPARRAPQTDPRIRCAGSLVSSSIKNHRVALFGASVLPQKNCAAPDHRLNSSQRDRQ